MRNTDRQPADMNAFRAALRTLGLKATPQRLAVHEAMLKLGHASADMVLEQIRSVSGIKITTASIYNILTTLYEKGLYARMLSQDSKMYFDINSSKHIHMFDTKCNEFRDVDDEGILKVVEEHFRKRKFRGYKVDGIEIQLICHSTRRKAKSEQTTICK